MRLFLIFNNIVLFLCLICEDLKRPWKREECFERTFIGEHNESNSYCCFLSFYKSGWETFKCSLHFKNEIDNNAIKNTIQFLKEVNTQYKKKDDDEEENNEIEDIKLDCHTNYIKHVNNIYLFIIVLLF